MAIPNSKISIFRKMQKNDNLLKTRILKLKYKLNGDQVFAFSFSGGQIAPLPPVRYATATNTLNID